ncbi:MAG: DUF2232 domain-containing protein [Solobacterium sp.]|nr:DUF2232 domain-containing protein [Solobacterium sp.]
MNHNVRKLTEGAMMCAIVGMMLLINRQTGGFIEDVFLFLFPLPMVFFAAKYGYKDALVVLVAITLLTVILGTPQTLFYVVSESIIGLIYGGGIYHKVNTKQLVLWTMFISVVVNLISMVILAKFFGYDMQTEMASYENALTNMTSQAGVALPSTFNMTQYLRTIMIVSVMLTGCMEGLITHFFSRSLLKRFKYEIPKSTPITEYFPPVWTGYVGLIGMIAVQYTMARPIPNELVNNLVQGFGMCGLMYLSFYGYMAIILFGRKRLPKFRIVVTIVGILLLFTNAILVAMLGFLYITTSLHKKLLEGDTHAAENV